MSYVQDPFSLQDRRIAYLHRPTQGWTVGEYILALQSKLASSTVQPWVGRSRTTPFPIRRHTGSIEGAFSPCSPIGFPCTQHPSYHQPKEYWWAILELVAAITRVFNIMGEEVLEAVVDESDGLASICELCRCKTVSQGPPTVELERFQCSLPPGSVSCHSGQCGVPTIVARSISPRGTLHQPSRHAAFAIAVHLNSPRIVLAPIAL